MATIKIDSFTIDKSLGYLIQNLTGDSTQEILGYYYGIAQFYVDNLNEKSSARWLDKNIVLFYKETPITYRIRVRGPGPGTYREIANISIDVTFPKDSSEFNVTELMTAMVESGLGLNDEQNMPMFEKPILKTPAALRKVRLEQEKAYELKRSAKQETGD